MDCLICQQIQKFSEFAGVCLLFLLKKRMICFINLFMQLNDINNNRFYKKQKQFCRNIIKRFYRRSVTLPSENKIINYQLRYLYI